MCSGIIQRLIHVQPSRRVRPGCWRESEAGLLGREWLRWLLERESDWDGETEMRGDCWRERDWNVGRVRRLARRTRRDWNVGLLEREWGQTRRHWNVGLGAATRPGRVARRGEATGGLGAATRTSDSDSERGRGRKARRLREFEWRQAGEGEWQCEWGVMFRIRVWPFEWVNSGWRQQYFLEWVSDWVVH